MRKLSIREILDCIAGEIPFEAVSPDYSFTLKVERYAPYLCAAVHDGHQFRKSLWDNCHHTEYERWFEEDPCTYDMIYGHPMVISGLDSRFEYDLNRETSEAIYKDAWGKKLWKQPLSGAERQRSLDKHEAFYRVAHAMVAKIEEKYGKALIIDMHSYNRGRWDRAIPTWNLGTANIDNSRFDSLATSWREKLSSVKLPYKIPETAAINDTFQGNGYFLKYLTKEFSNTLVLATEIAKVYCDETSGIIFPEVVHAVSSQLRHLIPRLAEEFSETRI